MKQGRRPSRAAASHSDGRSRVAGAGSRTPPPNAPRAAAGRPVLAGALAVALHPGLVRISGLAWRGTTAVPEFTRTFEGYLGAERDAGEWLSGVSAPGDAVMDRKP